ncbi:MAG: hypothetical protein EHM58_02465 [Ignavibacteriae bacterium]|nr:MAG: hypothetical protein EHM58_02465 [Ignavibacteriota bacterium]
MKNYFGHKIYSPFEILKEEKIRAPIIKAIDRIFKELCIQDNIKESILNDLFNMKNKINESQYENYLRKIIKCEIKKSNLKKAFVNRAKIIARQVSPFIIGDSIIDIGCGDGLVNRYLNKKVEKIHLIDIFKYVEKNLPYKFSLYKENSSFPQVPNADTTFLLTVLHHSKKPLHLIKETSIKTNCRTIIIESIYGSTRNPHKSSEELNALNIVQQRKYASFIDWFYNRVLHSNVQVPYNFQKPEVWETIFQKQGYAIHKSIDLGIDQNIVPERHFLFVLDKT